MILFVTPDFDKITVPMPAGFGIPPHPVSQPVGVGTVFLSGDFPCEPDPYRNPFFGPG